MILNLRMSLHFCLEYIMKHYVQSVLHRLNHNKTVQTEAAFTMVFLAVLFALLVYCKPLRCTFGVLQHSRDNSHELHNVSRN